ncbi:MAG TPA: ATP-binding protein, partial [Burkholderiaceae bacterium]
GVVQSEARASHLVDQLLALALADEARAAMPLVPVRLDVLVRDTVLRFLPRADAAGVDLGAQGLDLPVQVQAQPLLVEGILNNLIDNALRYGMPPPTAIEAPHITVELRREVVEVVMSVTDNGPGISDAQRDELLQRGAQGADGERLGQGAGLGLSIVARYAQLLGARLELRDGPGGRGLCARLVLAL